MASLETEAMVRGYHIYKDAWSAVIDEVFRASEKMATVSIPSLWLFVMAT